MRTRELPGVGGRLGERLPRVLLLPQRVERRDADDRAVHGVAELVGAQDDVERLVPRHVAQHDVDRALHVRVDDDVEAADLGERAQHRAEVGALEVEADRMAGEPLLPRPAVCCSAAAGAVGGGPSTTVGGLDARRVDVALGAGAGVRAGAAGLAAGVAARAGSTAGVTGRALSSAVIGSAGAVSGVIAAAFADRLLHA